MTDEIYKRLRPKKVEGVIGQDATTAAVEAKLSKGKWPHAAVFHGPSGTGKTTMARIVARRLGIKGKIPEPNLDYTEVNIAQTRGIDKVRRIVEGAGAAPLGGSPVRVWVLDEMHQMTKDGQNCVLKILEDPPEHAYFILCTTDPNKLVKAIRTRSTPFRFNSVKPAELKALVQAVCEKEEIGATEQVVDEIVAVADGSPREALVLLDLAAAERGQPRAMWKGIPALADPKDLFGALRAIFRRFALTFRLHASVDFFRDLLRKIDATNTGVDNGDAEFARLLIGLLANFHHQRGAFVAHDLLLIGFTKHTTHR